MLTENSKTPRAASATELVFTASASIAPFQTPADCRQHVVRQGRETERRASSTSESSPGSEYGAEEDRKTFTRQLHAPSRIASQSSTANGCPSPPRRSRTEEDPQDAAERHAPRHPRTARCRGPSVPVEKTAHHASVLVIVVIFFLSLQPAREPWGAGGDRAALPDATFSGGSTPSACHHMLYPARPGHGDRLASTADRRAREHSPFASRKGEIPPSLLPMPSSPPCRLCRAGDHPGADRGFGAERLHAGARWAGCFSDSLILAIAAAHQDGLFDAVALTLRRCGLELRCPAPTSRRQETHGFGLQRSIAFFTGGATPRPGFDDPRSSGRCSTPSLASPDCPQLLALTPRSRREYTPRMIAAIPDFDHRPRERFDLQGEV